MYAYVCGEVLIALYRVSHLSPELAASASLSGRLAPEVSAASSGVLG